MKINKVKKLNESLTPEVGPFFVIDGVVFADTDLIRDCKVSPIGTVDSDRTHYDYWRMLRRVTPEYRRVDYDYYPRGRVVYNTNSDKFFLYLDKCLRDDETVKNIIYELNLPRNKVEVRSDEHYQCHQCNPDYVDIEESLQD